jgi:hypothetical protein
MLPAVCGWFAFCLLRGRFGLVIPHRVCGCIRMLHCPLIAHVCPDPQGSSGRGGCRPLAGAGPHVSANPVRDACERPIQRRAARSRACGERCAAYPRHPGRSNRPLGAPGACSGPASFVPAPAPQPRRRPHAQRPDRAGSLRWLRHAQLVVADRVSDELAMRMQVRAGDGDVPASRLSRFAMLRETRVRHRSWRSRRSSNATTRSLCMSDALAIPGGAGVPSQWLSD